jgi:hypothetical protein
LHADFLKILLKFKLGYQQKQVCLTSQKVSALVELKSTIGYESRVSRAKIPRFPNQSMAGKLLLTMGYGRKWQKADQGTGRRSTGYY